MIDFEGYAAGTEIVLHNHDGDVPNIMKFIVTATPGHTAPLPATLATIPAIDPTTAVQSRDFVLDKREDTCGGEIWTINGLSFHDITEKPMLGTTEIWRFINDTGIAHPMHMHLVQFQILDRQPYMWMGQTPIGIGNATPPVPEEAGWKDTVAVNPGEMVRVIARFDDYTGKFAYHCHMLEHEDHDMMRQFEVVGPPNADDAGVDGDANDGGNSPGTGNGGGCCRTTHDGPPLLELVLVALAIFARRRRR